jgi:UDP-glucose 4-epimerase
MSRYGQHGYIHNKDDLSNPILLKPPFREYYPPAPVDPYGVAKVAAEDTLRILCETHNVKYSILVPHNIIGVRQRSVDPYRNVASIMINRCKQDKPPIIYGDGSQKRCFSPVKDCLPSIVKAVMGAVDGEVVNIGPDSGEITIKELADKIIRLTGYKGEAQYMPGRPNEVKDAFCSSDKARRLLGYEPKQSIDDCLQKMVDYIKPAPFVYDFPLEIVTDKIPKTWSERLM